jgi:ADP-ribose pyrophosphatase YjhB (NUDIX family)
VVEACWRVGVAGAVVRQGRVLLVRHTYGEKRGVWTLPGGFATHQERLDQSVMRELQEETGLDAEVVDLIAMLTQYDEQGAGVFAVFRMHAPSGEPVPDRAEVSQVGWFSVAEVRAMPGTELLSSIRNPVLAALEGDVGLADDPNFPDRGENARGFLVRRRLAG